MREGGAGKRHSGRPRKRRRLPMDHAVRFLAGAVLFPQIYRRFQRLRALHRDKERRAACRARRCDGCGCAGALRRPDCHEGQSPGRSARAAPCRAGDGKRSVVRPAEIQNQPHRRSAARSLSHRIKHLHKKDHPVTGMVLWFICRLPDRPGLQSLHSMRRCGRW